MELYNCSKSFLGKYLGYLEQVLKWVNGIKSWQPSFAFWVDLTNKDNNAPIHTHHLSLAGRIKKEQQLRDILTY